MELVIELVVKPFSRSAVQTFSRSTVQPFSRSVVQFLGRSRSKRSVGSSIDLLVSQPVDQSFPISLTGHLVSRYFPTFQSLLPTFIPFCPPFPFFLPPTVYLLCIGFKLLLIGPIVITIFQEVTHYCRGYIFRR